MMRPRHANYRSGEHRLIAFGGLQEIPKPATNPEKPAEPVVPPRADAGRVQARIEAVLSELGDMEHLVDKDAADTFRAKLEAIRAKFNALDASRTEAILALEKEAYADCAPFLERSFKVRLAGCPKILNPVLKKEKLDCEFGGEKITLTLTPSHQVSAVSVMGAFLPLENPVDIERFDVAVGENLISSLRLIAKRFDVKTLQFSANEARIEWTAEGKRFVASSVDVLEVVQSPKQEILENYLKISINLRKVRERCHELEKMFPSDTLRVLYKELRNEPKVKIDHLTAEQKAAWTELESIEKKTYSLEHQKRTLSDAACFRILRAEDGTTVHEKGDPAFTYCTNWTYLDAEGKNRKKVEWSWTMSAQSDYEKGQLVRSTNFSAAKNGLPTVLRDLKANTVDYFDDKGQKSYRQVLDPKDSKTVTKTLLFSATGTLLDEVALRAMAPEQIEAAFLGQLSRQKEDRFFKNPPIFESCYSCAKHLAKCPRVKDIFRLALRNNPTQAFTRFDTYQEIPGAVELLEEAAYQLGDKVAVTNLIDKNEAVAKLPQEQKKRIISLTNRKAVYDETFVPKYLRKDYDPEKKTFLADPALLNLEEVQRATRSQRYWVGEVPLSWLRHFKDQIDANHMPAMTYAEISDVEQQMMVMIARNLYFQNKAVTRETVMAETKRILDTRKQYADIPLFAGRNVLHIAHGEKIRESLDNQGKPYSNWQYDDAEKNAGDTYRFAPIGTQKAIERQQNGRGSYSLLRPALREEAKVIKARVLQAIRTIAPPATFLFDGHGGPDAFYLSDGQLSGQKNVELNAVKLSVEELADAFAERAQKFEQLKTDDPAKKDICIFKSCYSATLTRLFYQRLQGLPKPVTLASAEYGQKGYSDWNDPLISKFSSNVMQLGRDNGVTTFADVFRQEFSGPTNPSLYIPDESGQTMQISRNDTPSEPSNG